MALNIVIPGRPVPKKNSPVMIAKRALILPSKAYREYERYCIGTARRPGVLMQWGNVQYKEPVHVCARYWLPDKRWWPDLIGLMQATADLLEKAGIVVNDRLIISWDGSRIMGVDKDNPRADITITEME